MAAVNVSDSRDNSLTPLPSEKSTTGKSAPRKTRQGVAKNPNLAPQLTNKQTADQAFHDAASEIVPDSQLQNKVANLERQVLEAKKAALQKQLQTLTSASTETPAEELAANSVGAKTQTLACFMSMKVRNLILFPLCASIGQ